ncbi:MAG: hypothetical protein AcusKO_27980 [Acuticoccus sp.]
MPHAGGGTVRQDLAHALKALGDGVTALEPDGGLSLTRGGTALSVPSVAVVAMVQEGLLARRGATVCRTAEGRAFLRRAEAGPTDNPFAAQHRDVRERRLEPGADAGTLRVNVAESPLLWLSTRRSRDGAPLIDPAQLKAGQRLARDYESGHRRERITQSWDASGVRSAAPREKLCLGEAAGAARRRVETALDAVGPGLAEVLVAICCEERGLEATERRFGWPARCGKVVLKLALDRLAAHYGIGLAARGSGDGLVHWGGEGYRPQA